MGKKTFFAALIIYTLVLVLPPTIYIIANFYTYLFDGWQLNAKFANALFWLMFASPPYGIFVIIYSDNHRKWGDK